MTRTLVSDRSVEPLFALRERLWLRVWAVTQSAALVIGSGILIDRAGGVRPLLASAEAPRLIAALVALIAYHVVGYRAIEWILRRPWAVGLFVPLGWALVMAASQFGIGYGLLIFGAIIQGFVFLPFRWAIGVLALVIGSAAVGVWPRDGRLTGLVVARLAGLLATGVMIGTVMLYIHRVNRDAAIRARLLVQLDAAQRELADRARESGVQDERRRLAHDLHDTLAQGFTSVITHLEAIELSFVASNGDEPMQRARTHLGHAQAVSRASLAEIRRLVWALRPPQLAEASLGAAIERTVAQWSAASGVEATCAIDPLPALHPDADVIFLRATQEALSNVARHANARRVAVALHSVDGLVLLSVEDDGRGFADLDEAASHLRRGVGLTGMRERVRRFGGRVLIENATGAGASVTVALPLDAIAAPVA